MPHLVHKMTNEGAGHMWGPLVMCLTISLVWSGSKKVTEKVNGKGKIKIRCTCKKDLKTKGQKENGIRNYFCKCVIRNGIYNQIYKLWFLNISLEIGFENLF